MKRQFLVGLAVVGVALGTFNQTFAAEPATKSSTPAAQPASPSVSTATPAKTPGQLAREKGIADVVKLSKAGVEPKLIQTFLIHSNIAFVPNFDEIIHLRVQGVSQEIITSMIQRGSDARSQAIGVATREEQIHEAMLAARQRVMFSEAYQPGWQRYPTRLTIQRGRDPRSIGR